jgi:hypothetical protein
MTNQNAPEAGSESSGGLGGEVFKVEYRLSMEFQATTLDGIRERLPKGAQIIAVNGREFVASCECCGKVICEGDGYYAPEDCYLCRPCGDELKANA